MKKHISAILSIVLIIVIISSCFMMLALKKRMDNMQQQIDFYRPYYTSTIGATYGDGNIVQMSEVNDQYNLIVSRYARYGLDLVSMGWDRDIKLEILQGLVMRAVLLKKAYDLGLDRMTAEEIAQLSAASEQRYNDYVSEYISEHNNSNTMTDSMTAEAEAYLSSKGINHTTCLSEVTDEHILEKLRHYITDDVIVSDETVHTVYNDRLSSQTSTFNADPDAFITAYNDGDLILFDPEGYRLINYILVPFTDEQASRYFELTETLKTLEYETNSDSDRSPEDISADIDACNAELDDLFSELDPSAYEITVQFNAGVSFNTLVTVHAPTLTIGNNEDGSQTYPVCSNNTYWDNAFTAAAMSIPAPGQISEPIRSSYGLYIIYYADDLKPGAIPFEDIREQLREELSGSIKEEAYQAQVDLWLDEAHPVYYYENIGFTTEDIPA